MDTRVCVGTPLATPTPVCASDSESERVRSLSFTFVSPPEGNSKMH